LIVATLEDQLMPVSVNQRARGFRCRLGHFPQQHGLAPQLPTGRASHGLNPKVIDQPDQVGYLPSHLVRRFGERSDPGSQQPQDIQAAAKWRGVDSEARGEHREEFVFPTIRLAQSLCCLFLLPRISLTSTIVG